LSSGLTKFDRIQFLFIGVSILVLMIGVDSSPMHFFVRIRGRFHLILEMGEISPMASQAQAQTLLHHREEDGGRRPSWCRVRADAARPCWATTRAMRETRMGGQAGLAGWNSTHGQ
jgi:hypothetical protein